MILINPAVYRNPIDFPGRRRVLRGPAAVPPPAVRLPADLGLGLPVRGQLQDDHPARGRLQPGQEDLRHAAFRPHLQLRHNDVISIFLYKGIL